MKFLNLLVTLIICLFNDNNGVQTWSFQQNGFNPNPRIIDLELCMVWPWQGPQKRSSILQIDVVKCQPYEICSPEPNTRIYGLGLGYIT